MSIAMVLFLIFLVLKLAAIGVVATWSWWWITAPLWIGFVLALAVYVIAAAVFVFAGVDVLRGRKHRR